MLSSKSNFFRPIASVILSGLIFSLSPGIPCYQALAAVIDATPESGGVSDAAKPLPLSLGEISLPISDLNLPATPESSEGLDHLTPNSLSTPAQLPVQLLSQKTKETVRVQLNTSENTLSQTEETFSRDSVLKISNEKADERHQRSDFLNKAGMGKKISGLGKILFPSLTRLHETSLTASETSSLGRKIWNALSGIYTDDKKGQVLPEVVAYSKSKSLSRYFKHTISQENNAGVDLPALGSQKSITTDAHDILKPDTSQTPSAVRPGTLRRVLTALGGTFLATALWNILQAHSVFSPSFSIIHSPYDFMGLMGAFLLKLASVPQTFKNFRMGKLATKDISLSGTLIWFSSSTLLFLVSFLKHSSSIWVFSNILGVAQGALMGTQVVFYNHKGYLPLFGAVGAAGLMISLVTSGIWTPMAALIPVLFWTAMSLVLSINIPQIIRNYKLYRLEHRAPAGIDPVYPGFVAMGSSLSLLTALHRLDLYWILINITAVLMPLVVMAQILKPKVANGVLSKIPLPKKLRIRSENQENPSSIVTDPAPTEEKNQSTVSPETVSPLAQDFIDNLMTYHRLDGRKDGSGSYGVQYPPVPKVKNGDEAGLKSFIEDLSVYLARQLGIDYLPTPSGPGERSQFRKEVAQKSATEIEEYATQEFNAMVESLSDEDVKTFIKKALAEAQPEFWRAPSSSSGRFHPADEINAKGLLVHSIRDAVVGRMLADYFGLSATEKDIIVAALLIHDIEKGGIPWKHDNKTGSAPDSGYDPAHGPDAADWLKQFETHSCGPKCDEIIQDIRAHMAQWNKPVSTPPKTLGEQIVSYADYLASRDDVYVSWRASEAGVPISSSPAKK